uniref:Tetraspanin n=1 Tax=Anas platyrhynchos platyrhynchos TaxID=8840 RepID=U3I185_ANAPP
MPGHLLLLSPLFFSSSPCQHPSQGAVPSGSGSADSRSPSAPATGTMTALKLSLMAFSFVFWAAGLTMLIIGLWAKVWLGGYLALSASNYPDAPAILLATGTAVIVWGFLGCFSAATEHRGLLRTYGAFLSAVLVAGLIAGLSGLLYHQDVARGFQEGLRQALNTYGEDEVKADALDALQRALACCGVESYRDWLTTPWALHPPNMYELHRDGCFSKVSAFVSSNMFSVATAALGLAALQVIGIYRSRLCCNCRNNSAVVWAG